MATLHVRPPGAILERSDAMHAVELARLLGRHSLEARDRYLGVREYERSPVRADARNGFFYERDVVTRLGTVRVLVARTRQRAFLPAGLVRLERRAAVLLLIREAFLRGPSTRAVGREVALLTEEAVVHRRSRG